MLNKKIADFLEKTKGKASKENMEVMQKSFEKLKAEDIESKVIKVGDKLPQFNLVDTEGNVYTNDSFGGSKLILNFFRGSW